MAPPDAVQLLADLPITVVTQPGFIRERGDAYLADVTTAELADGSRVGAAVLDSGDSVLLADEGIATA